MIKHYILRYHSKLQPEYWYTDYYSTKYNARRAAKMWLEEASDCFENFQIIDNWDDNMPVVEYVNK